MVQETYPVPDSYDAEQSANSTESFDVSGSQPRPSWRSPRILLIVAGLIILGTGFLGSRYLSRPESASEPVDADAETVIAQRVTDVVVVTQPIQEHYEATGTVVAADLLPVLPKTSGLQLEQIFVDEGDTVAQGQLLATLDNAVLQAQILQQTAEIAAAEATVQQRQAALEQARAALSEAETNLRRFQDLASEGAISRQELDTRSTTFQTAQESVRLAAANILSAEANVQSEQARLQQLNIQLEQTQVRAPAAGLIAERFARIGDLASNSQPLFSLIRDRRLELEVELPETELSQIRPGTTVEITADSDPDLAFETRLTAIAPLVDPTTRQARLDIDLPSSDQLRPGMFLRATFTIATRLGIAIPTEAVVPQPDGGNLVYRLDAENRVIAQPVELGSVLNQDTEQALANQTFIEIQAGLSAGDRIVVTGARYLKDGDFVQVIQQSL